MGNLAVLLLLFLHHSAAMYDLTKTFTYQGTVTEVIWENPHVIFVMKGAEAGIATAKPQELAFEAPSPANLLRNSGFAQKTIKKGDKVTVRANPAKNGKLPMYLVSITAANGKEFTMRPPEQP